ncbi:MAG: FMN-binding negative transcriptional regulator [Burkholderiales bacterium]|nr:FMN-binding negative transcriptional regulator [Burkholderiales bacterium]
MYNPPHFEETDSAELLRLIADHPLGALVARGPQGLDANHLPFEFLPDPAPQGTLIAHVARANPLWQELRDGDEALVVFRAEDAYVSPNWYPSKHEAHRQVPTWNYRVVHAHGRIRIRDDERFVREVVARLTRRHEARTGDPKPWKMGDASPAYLDEMLARIVGIEVAIERLAGKWKLSQNKEMRDRLGAADALEARGGVAIAKAMREAPHRPG